MTGRVVDVAAVDDDQMLLGGLVRHFADVADLRLAATASTVDELLAAHRRPFDVVLLDLLLRDGSQPAANVRRLTAAGHRVLVISVWGQPEQVAEVFAAGAAGYVTKDHDLAELGAAIRAVAAGAVAYSAELAAACLDDSRPQRPRLSPRERAVLVAYASGMTLNAAARHVGVRPETARTYLERVKTKYQEAGRPAPTKLDLANRAREDRLSP